MMMITSNKENTILSNVISIILVSPILTSTTSTSHVVISAKTVISFIFASRSRKKTPGPLLPFQPHVVSVAGSNLGNSKRENVRNLT